MFELFLLATAIPEKLSDPCLGDAACYAELAAQNGTDAMAEEAVAEEAVAEEASDAIAIAGEAPTSTDPNFDNLDPGSRAWGRKIDEILRQPRPPNAGDVISAQLAEFRGEPSQYAFNRLGYPDAKMTVEGATVYSWLNQTSNIDGSPLRCTVKIVVRAAKIVSTDFNGNEGACARFARKLDPKYRPHY